MASIAQIRGAAPIITAASTVTTTAISMSYDIANHSDEKGAYYCEWTTLGDFTGIAFSVAGARLYAAPTNAYTSDGTTSPAASYTHVVGTFNKEGSVYGESLAVNANGNWSSEVAYDGAYSTLTEIPVCVPPDTAMLVRNIRRYNLNYTAAKAKIDELMT